MITLAQSAREARLLLKYGSILISAALLILIIFRFGVFIKNTFFPTPPAPPEQRFGALPELSFRVEGDYNPTFRINTETGFLPVFPDRIPVFTLVQPGVDILTVQRIRREVANADFSEEERKLSETVYEWVNKKYPDSYITYDIVNKNFDISSNYKNDPAVIAALNLPRGARAVKIAFDFLSTISKDTQNLDFNRSIVSYYRIVDGEFVRSEEENSQVVKVALFKKTINEIPIEYNSNKDSEMIFYIASGESNPRIIHATYKETTINYNDNSTYPLKTSEQAFEDLKMGNARILDFQTTGFVDILKVYPAYYIGDENKEYLLPIIVFEGKGFKAYVNAIPTSTQRK